MDSTRLNSLAALGGDIKDLVDEVLRLRNAKPERTVAPDSPIRDGNNVFIRTVTHHYTGKIVNLLDDEIILADAAWIADDGRFYQALKDGQLNEVEPFPGIVSIGRGSIIDVTDWVHDLPRVQK